MRTFVSDFNVFSVSRMVFDSTVIMDFLKLEKIGFFLRFFHLQRLELDLVVAISIL